MVFFIVGTCPGQYRTDTVRKCGAFGIQQWGWEAMAEKDGRFTITEAADRIGVSTKTIIRWEKARRIARAKRDWRGWRVFTEQQVSEMIKLHEQLY